MKIRSIVTACSIGNFLEWYDFTLFGYLAPLLGPIFFPATPGYSALFNSLIIFAVGFLMRPFGSILFGLIGDRAGRKFALILSILLITIPTFLIGALPSYLQIGIAATMILTVLRVFQGIPIGGEVGGIMCYLTEIAPAGKKGFIGSFAFFGASIGFIISSLEIYAFEKWMSPEHFHAWGWRLSFLIGGLLGLFGWYLRRHLHETPAFHYVLSHHQILKNPVIATFKKYKMHIFQTFCVSALSSGGFYITSFFFSFFFRDVLKMDFAHGLLINAGMIGLSCLCMPFFGKLGDRFGIKRLMIIGSVGVICLSYFMFLFASENRVFLSLVFQAALTISITLNYSLLPAFLYKMFPTPVRYTGVGIGYNLSNAILGGPSPLFSLYLVQLTGSAIAPAFFLMALGLITLIPFLSKDPALREIR